MIIGISFVQLVTFKLAQFISLIPVYVKVAEYLNALLLKGHIPNARRSSLALTRVDADSELFVMFLPKSLLSKWKQCSIEAN